MPDRPTPREAPRNAGRAFALVLVDELAGHGVTDAVIAPGSRSTPVALALVEDGRIRVHVRVDERSAAYLALGLAKASGRPVPVLCTSGTAASYFLGAAMEADQARIPLLLLTADRPPELRGVGANQTVDQVGLYGGTVRWAVDVGVPENRDGSVRYWRSLVARAVATASGYAGPPGPVHLNLPLREPLADVDDGIGWSWPLDDPPAGPATAAVAVAGAGLPADFAGVLARARRGVIVAGDGLSDADADAVVAFGARAGWPVIAEPQSNARRGPGAIRFADPLLVSPGFASAHAPDLVVVAGRVQLSRVVGSWYAGQPHAVVDRFGAWWDPARRAGWLVHAAPALLADAEVAPADPAWLADWLAADALVSAALDRALDAEPGLTEPAVARDVVASMAAGSTLLVASSMPIRDLDITMAQRQGVRVLANRGVSGIDGFASTAQGIALACDGPVVALAGDLSMMHDLPGLLPGPDPRPALTYVVVDNHGGGIFSLLPQAATTGPATFERVFGTDPGVDLPRLAAALDMDVVHVSGRDELVAALAGPAPTGVRLLHVSTDRLANADLHRRLREVCGAALTS